MVEPLSFLRLVPNVYFFMEVVECKKHSIPILGTPMLLGVHAPGSLGQARGIAVAPMYDSVT